MHEEKPIEEGEVLVDMRRHSIPEYLDLIVGSTFDELEALDEGGKIDGSGIAHPQGFDLALRKAREIISSGQKPEIIAVSPLERAKQTALLINGELTKETEQKEESLPICVIPELKELSPTAEDYEFSRNLMLEKGLLSNPSGLSTGKEAGIYFYTALHHFFDLHRAEIEEAADAAISRLQKLAQERKCRRILVISHGFNLGIIKARIRGEDIASVLDSGEKQPLEGYSMSIGLESGLINIFE